MMIEFEENANQTEKELSELERNRLGGWYRGRVLPSTYWTPFCRWTKME